MFQAPPAKVPSKGKGKGGKVEKGGGGGISITTKATNKGKEVAKSTGGGITAKQSISKGGGISSVAKPAANRAEAVNTQKKKKPTVERYGMKKMNLF